MKRLIALFVALMLLFSAAAVAEESSLYRASLYDPIVYIDSEPVLDMTGLNIDVDAVFTDVGPLGLMLELYAGENYDFLTGAYAQVDENGLSFYLDGMSNIYSADVTSLLGTDPYAYLAAMALRTMIDEIDFSAVSFDVNIPAEARVAFMEEFFGGLVVSSADGVNTLQLTKEQGAELVSVVKAEMEQLMPAIDAYAAQAGVSTSDIQEIIEAITAFDISGTMTKGEHFSVEAAFNIYANDGSSIPFSIVYDDVTEAAALTFDLFNGSIVIDWVISDNEDNAGVTQAFMLSTADSTTSWGLSIETGFSADCEHSVRVDLDIYEGEEYASYLYLYYEGDYEENDGAPYSVGYFEGGVYDGFNEYALGTTLYLEAVDVDTADWMVDSSNAIDVMNMTENETNAAMMGLMGVIGNVMPMLQSAVPSLAPIIESMFSDM